VKNIFIFFIRAVLLIVCISDYSYTADDKKATKQANLEIIQKLAERIADSIYASIPTGTSDTVNLSFKPSTDSWIVEHAITKRLKEYSNLFIKSGDFSNQNLTIDFAISKISIKYKDSFKERFFGTQKTNRWVEVKLAKKITFNNEILSVGTSVEQYHDTVDVNSINELENQSIPLTRGSLPDDSFIDRILVPTVVLSSVAVIVYLFFTLRK